MEAGKESKQELKRLIACVIGCSAADIDDTSDFFGLGADSVGAMKFANAAQKAGFKMTIAMIYEHPTVSELVECCPRSKSKSKPKSKLKGTDHDRPDYQPEQKADVNHMQTYTTTKNADQSVADYSVLLEHWELIKDCMELGISPDAIEDIYPAFPSQEILLALMLESVFEFKASDEVEARVVSALERIHQVDPMMRTRLVKHKRTGNVYQVVLEEKIEWDREGGTMEEYSICNGRQSMGFGDRLCRFALVKNKHEEKAHIVWTLCHAITDRSSRVELNNRIGSYFQNPESPTLSLPSVRTLISHNQTTHATSLAFWKSRLRDLHLPHYFPRLPKKQDQDPTQQPYTKRFVTRAIPVASSSTLGVPHSILCHVAWSICLANLSKNPSIIFTSAGSGRQLPPFGNNNDDDDDDDEVMDLSQMSGPILCPTPFHVDFSPSSPAHKTPMKDFLKKVQLSIVEGLEHEHAAYDAVVEKFDVQSRGYLPNVFNYSTISRALTYDFSIADVGTAADGDGACLHIAQPKLHGWFEPPPQTYLGVSPEPVGAQQVGGKGEGKKLRLLTIFDDRVVELAVMEKLLADMEDVVRKLCDSAPWHGMTVSNFLDLD